MKRSAHLLDRLSDDLFALIGGAGGEPPDGQHPAVAAGIETMASFLSCVAEDLREAATRGESDAATLARLVETARGVLNPVCDGVTLDHWRARTARYGALAALEETPSAVQAAHRDGCSSVYRGGCCDCMVAERGPRIYCQGEEDL